MRDMGICWIDPAADVIPGYESPAKKHVKQLQYELRAALNDLQEAKGSVEFRTLRVRDIRRDLRRSNGILLSETSS